MNKFLKYSNVFNITEPIEKLAFQLDFLYYDMVGVLNSISIYKNITDKKHCVANMVYNSYYSEIQTALIYRIFSGISKVLDSHSESYSYIKVLNAILQSKEYKNNEQVKKQINISLSEINAIKKNNGIKEMRDKFFSHLDKECVVSSLRLGLFIHDISELETVCKRILASIYNICGICFDNSQLKYNDGNFEIPNVYKINDFQEKVNEASSKNIHVKKVIDENKKYVTDIDLK